VNGLAKSYVINSIANFCGYTGQQEDCIDFLKQFGDESSFIRLFAFTLEEQTPGNQLKTYIYDTRKKPNTFHFFFCFNIDLFSPR